MDTAMFWFVIFNVVMFASLITALKMIERLVKD